MEIRCICVMRQSCDDVLVDGAQNDVDPFEVSFTANMSNMPSVTGVAYVVKLLKFRLIQEH